MLNLKKIRLSLVIFLIFGFSVFIIIFEKRSRINQKQSLHKHAKVISNALWKFDTESPFEYLKLATIHDDYQLIKIYLKPENKLFLTIKGGKLKGMDRFLSRLGMISRKKLSEKIRYKSKIIGEIEVIHLHTTIYTYFYIILVIALTAVSILFFLKTVEAKATLEIMVEKRTREYRESEQLYHNLIANIPGITYICLPNRDFFMKFISEAIQTISGYPASDFIENRIRPFKSIIHQDDREKITKHISDTITKNKGFDIQYRIVDANGQKHWVHDKGNAFYDTNDQTLYLQGVIIDITDQKNNEIELEEYRDNLEQLVEKRTNDLKNTQMRLYQADKMASLGVLTAGVAHEINNPLNYVLNGHSLIEAHHNAPDQSGLTDAEISEILDKIKIGIERIENIVVGLNQFSRDNTNFDEECNLNIIIENCLTMLYNKYKRKVDIRKDYKINKCIITGNSGKLHQAVLNILNNAIQSIPEKGKITISTGQDTAGIYISFSDTGIGIRKENIDRITDPFFTTKSPGEGTGLGLSITYNIIESHKGRLDIQSEWKKGTTVTISFPVNNTMTT